MGLAGMEKRLFQALVDRDRAKAGEKAAAETVVEGLRRSVGAPKAAMPGSLSQSFFAIEVFCAFGLFGNAATEEQLVSVYGVSRRAPVRPALTRLWKVGCPAGGDGGP